MKKITIILALIICSLATYSQETNVEKNVILDVPAGFSKPNKQELKTFLSNRKNNKITNVDKFNGSIYRFEDIILQLSAGPAPAEENFLEKQKKGFDALYREIPSANYISTMKTVNDNPHYILKYQSSDYRYQRVVIANKKRTKVLIGVFEYKNAIDDSKVTAIINKLITQLKFK